MRPIHLGLGKVISRPPVGKPVLQSFSISSCQWKWSVSFMNHRIVLLLIHYYNECVLKMFSQNRTFPILWHSKQQFVPKIGIISFAVTKILCHFGFISETSWIKLINLQVEQFKVITSVGLSMATVVFLSLEYYHIPGNGVLYRNLSKSKEIWSTPKSWFLAFTYVKSVRKVMPMCLRRKRRGYLI